MKFILMGIALILTTLILPFNTARAAAPISHVVVAIQLIEKGKLDIKKEDIPAFIRGTSFNDIRYLEVIDRKLTHTTDVTWEMVQNEQDPFKKGMLLHSLLDVAREKYMVENNIYRFVPEAASSLRTQVVKFVEDQVVYDMVSDWNSVKTAFDLIDEGERSFAIADPSINQWHDILGNYFSERPTSQNIVSLIEKLRGENSNYKKLVPVMDNLEKNDDFRSIILNFYQNADYYLEMYGK